MSLSPRIDQVHNGKQPLQLTVVYNAVILAYLSATVAGPRLDYGASLGIINFIERSNICASRGELVALFENTLLEFGVDKFVYSLARGSFTANHKTHHGLARSYPEAWMKHYTEHAYIDSDPTYRHALGTKGAFTWKSLRDTIALSKSELQVMNEAQEAGLQNGVTLSLHGAFGEVFGFGFASEVHTDPFTRNELSELYAIANQFHLVYLGFDGPREFPEVALSNRQREVLQWVAIGKSRSQISEIMTISEDTVDDHFRHIFRKLVCNDRTVAVLKAIQYGLVRI